MKGNLFYMMGYRRSRVAKSSRPQTANTKKNDRKQSLPEELDTELNQVNVSLQKHKRQQSKKNGKIKQNYLYRKIKTKL
jgi:hypothetical protein